jgi:hypothetical protein
MDKEHTIELKELFPETAPQIHPDHLQAKAATRIAAALGLSYTPPAASAPSNVCQANAEDVLPQYRTTVTAAEICYYLLAVLESSPHNPSAIPYPAGPENFWAQVDRGRIISEGGKDSLKL